MAHFDFREALSNPEEKVFSPQATALAIPATAALSPFGKNFLSGVGGTVGGVVGGLGGHH